MANMCDNIIAMAEFFLAMNNSVIQAVSAAAAFLLAYYVVFEILIFVFSFYT